MSVGSFEVFFIQLLSYGCYLAFFSGRHLRRLSFMQSFYNARIVVYRFLLQVKNFCCFAYCA